MAKTTVFDVLIVYSGKTASSAKLAPVDILAPFSSDLNIVYGYFLETCKKNNFDWGFCLRRRDKR